MTPQQLKNSILQMAMQGKLVEQRPEEGTGEELYTQLQKSKKIFAEQRGYKQEKVLDIKDTEIPFEIPANWTWSKVGNLTLLFNGKAFKPSDWTSKGLPIVRIQNLNSSNAPYNYYDGPVEDDFHLFGGELLFAWSGTPGTSFGAHIWNGQEAVLNQHIFKLVYDEKCLDKKYFSLALNFQVFQLIQLAHGSAGLQHVTKGVFRNTLIPLPPLAEQKRIVEKIEELLPYIDRYGNAYNRLESYNSEFPDDLKKSILQEAIQGKLVPQDPNDEPASVLLEKIAKEKQKLIKEGKIKKQKPLPPITEDEIPFEIPESWEWVHLIDSVIDVQDIDHKMPAAQVSGIPFISPKDFTLDGINYESAKKISIEDYIILSKKCCPKKNDIIFPRYGTIGELRIIDTDKKILVSYSSCIIKPSIYVNYKFLYYALSSSWIKQEINKYINKTTQPNVGKQSICRFLLPIPPLAEQHRIVAKLEYLLSYANQCRTNI